MNNKGADQTALMRRLVCACVVRQPPKTGFLTSRPNYGLLSRKQESAFPLKGRVKWLIICTSFSYTKLFLYVPLIEMTSRTQTDFSLAHYSQIKHFIDAKSFYFRSEASSRDLVLIASASSESSDEPAHMRRPVRAFSARKHIERK